MNFNGLTRNNFLAENKQKRTYNGKNYIMGIDLIYKNVKTQFDQLILKPDCINKKDCKCPTLKTNVNTDSQLNSEFSSPTSTLEFNNKINKANEKHNNRFDKSLKFNSLHTKTKSSVTSNYNYNIQTSSSMIGNIKSEGSSIIKTKRESLKPHINLRAISKECKRKIINLNSAECEELDKETLKKIKRSNEENQSLILKSKINSFLAKATSKFDDYSKRDNNNCKSENLMKTVQSERVLRKIPKELNLNAQTLNKFIIKDFLMGDDEQKIINSK